MHFEKFGLKFVENNSEGIDLKAAFVTAKCLMLYTTAVTVVLHKIPVQLRDKF